MSFYNEIQKNGIDVVQSAMKVTLGGSKTVIQAFAGNSVIEKYGDLYYDNGRGSFSTLQIGDVLLKNPYTHKVTIIPAHRLDKLTGSMKGDLEDVPLTTYTVVIDRKGSISYIDIEAATPNGALRLALSKIEWSAGMKFSIKNDQGDESHEHTNI